MIKAFLVAGLVGASFALTPFASDAEAKVRVKVKTKYYTVTGKTGKDLYRSILKRGPKANSQHAIATTAYDLKFRNIDADILGSRCKITKVDTDVTLTYTYPKWRDYKRASPALQRHWDKFYGYLVRHEEKHGKIFINGTKSLERQMKRASGRVAKGCTDLEASMDRRVQPLMRRIARQQINFDKREGFRFSQITRAELRLLRGK